MKQSLFNQALNEDRQQFSDNCLLVQKQVIALQLKNEELSEKVAGLLEKNRSLISRIKKTLDPTSK